MPSGLCPSSAKAPHLAASGHPRSFRASIDYCTCTSRFMMCPAWSRQLSSYSISMTPLPVHRSVSRHRQPLRGPGNLSGAKEDKTPKQASQRKRENTVSCPNHSTSQSTSIPLNRPLSLQDFAVTNRAVHTCIRSMMFRAS